MVLQAIRFSKPTDSKPASLEILDQLALPHRSTYLPVTSCEDAHAAIKQMKVRGAPAIAIVAALALAVELSYSLLEDEIPSEVHGVTELIGKRLEYLKTSRPTAVNLGDAVGKLNAVVKKATADKESTSKDVIQTYLNAAQRMLVDDVQDNEAIGENGANWIRSHTSAGRRRAVDNKGELKVLTHCNTGSLATAGYGTALGVIRSLHGNGLLTHAYCSETRPYNQGSRLTAYELVHDQIPATLVTDSMAATLLAQEGDNIAAIVVGADRVAANGDTANKIGTYSLAVLARHHDVKFLVAAPRTTIDLSTPSGIEIVIEERASQEVTQIRGPRIDDQGKAMIEEDPTTVSIAAIGIGVWNPAFDVTPAELIDGIVTEIGVIEKGLNGKFDFRPIFPSE